jgi:hypothetical protein
MEALVQVERVVAVAVVEKAVAAAPLEKVEAVAAAAPLERVEVVVVAALGRVGAAAAVQPRLRSLVVHSLARVALCPHTITVAVKSLLFLLARFLRAGRKAVLRGSKSMAHRKSYRRWFQIQASSHSL